MFLREKDKNRLIEIFSSMTTPITVWGYGSRVNGKAHSGSDLDLVLRTEDLKPIASHQLNTLCEKITNSNIPILVELMDWALLPNNFHNNIESNYEVLFSSQDLIVNEPKMPYGKD